MLQALGLGLYPVFGRLAYPVPHLAANRRIIWHEGKIAGQKAVSNIPTVCYPQAACHAHNPVLVSNAPGT